MKNILGFFVSYTKDKTCLFIEQMSEDAKKQDKEIRFSWVSAKGELAFMQRAFLKLRERDKGGRVSNYSEEISNKTLTKLELKKLTDELTKFMADENRKEFFYENFHFPKVIASAIWEFSKGCYLDFNETPDNSLEFSTKTIPNVFDKLD